MPCKIAFQQTYTNALQEMSFAHPLGRFDVLGIELSYLRGGTFFPNRRRRVSMDLPLSAQLRQRWRSQTIQKTSATVARAAGA